MTGFTPLKILLESEITTAPWLQPIWPLAALAALLFHPPARRIHFSIRTLAANYLHRLLLRSVAISASMGAARPTRLAAGCQESRRRTGP